MTPQEALAQLESTVIMSIMRGNFPPDVAHQLVEVFLEEGLNVFEFTMNSPQALEGLIAIKKHFGSRVVAGMGTVLDTETAQRVIDAGADFVVSPALQPEVVEYVMKKDVFMIPGVITATECVNAWSMGVPLLKLFPIGALGVEYFKAIYGPLNHMKFMMNGAMGAENGQQFLQAGAVALGIGGWLTGDGTWTESRLRSRAHVAVNAVQAARGGVVQQA